MESVSKVEHICGNTCTSQRKLPKKWFKKLLWTTQINEIFQPQWLFYDDMDSFLKDFIFPHPTESNLEKCSRTDIPSQKACTKK